MVTQGVDFKVALQTETFSNFLRSRNRSLASQIDKQNYGDYNPYMANQMQMMMGMMMMNMCQNPQNQMMLMQMMSNPQAFQQASSGQRGNLFVRKAKEHKGDHEHKKRGFKDRKEDKHQAKDQKVEVARGRLDSDSFPPLTPGAKKQIMTDGRTNRKGILN